MDDLALFRRTFAGRRVLVTGHTGFKGSWLCEWLLALGAEVHGFALPPSHASDLFALLGLDARVGHTLGDVRDSEALQKTFARTEPEVVFHLAAQALVRASYDDAKGTFDTNVGGSVNLLEAVRGTPSVRSLVFVTSDKCYRNKEWVWGYREDDELGGRDPYAASKAAAEIVFASYADSFFHARPDLGAASARAGNAIGGGDTAPDRLVPNTMNALQRGDTVRLRNPHSTRPWQHVLDPLGGYLLLATRLLEEPKRWGGAWNFGPGEEDTRTVEALASALIRGWGSGTLDVAPDPRGPHEAGLLMLSSEKARQQLDWSGRWGFERAVAETCDWYKRVAAGEPAGDVTRAQIALFERS